LKTFILESPTLPTPKQVKLSEAGMLPGMHRVAIFWLTLSHPG